MLLIKELIEMADDVIFSNGLDVIKENLDEMREIYNKMINEGFIDNHRGDLDRRFDDLEKKLIAARRALGYVNSAKFDPQREKEQKKKILSSINSFRKQLYDLMIEMGMSQKEVDYHTRRLDMDKNFGKPSEIFDRNVPASSKEGNSFRDQFNKTRNLANPNDGESTSIPRNSRDRVRWYHKFFNRG